MQKVKVVITVLLGGLLSVLSHAQVGGSSTYTFLNLPSSARSAAAGGDVISVRDNDLNLVMDNPALLDSNSHDYLTLSYINWLSDVNFGYGAYARHYEGVGTFSAGMQFISYGTFTQTDEFGQITGEFKAGEYALDVSYSNQLDSNWTFGGSVKLIYSGLASYQSFGAAIDAGVHYQNNTKNFQAGAVVNNLGTQFKTYRDGNREPLPFEVQMAMSQKLPNAPLRFTLLASNLQQWDLRYNEAREGTPTVNPAGGLSIDRKKDDLITADMVLRHLVFGAEILITQNFNLRLAYNYQRRQEMGVAARGGITGLSFGVGFKMRRFLLSWGLAQYHLAGASNHFTITTNLADFKRH